MSRSLRSLVPHASLHVADTKPRVGSIPVSDGYKQKRPKSRDKSQKTKPIQINNTEPSPRTVTYPNNVRVPNTREMRFHVKEHVLSHLGAKDRRPSARAQGKEKIIFVFKHARQDGLHQRVVRIDQEVPGPKSIEREGKVDHCQRWRYPAGNARAGSPWPSCRRERPHRGAVPQRRLCLDVCFDQAKG